MRVLLVGAGGREHALAWCLRKSPLLSALFMAPGNPGMAELGTCINIDVTDIAALVDFAKAENIDLVVPGPEAPLVAGLTDACDAAGIACAGPTQAAAALEGSKAFTKEIADAAGIPTARWERFDTAEAAHDFIQRRGAPIVIKADGLAAGKGVIVAQTVEEAQKAVDTMLTHGGFGSAGSSIVVEECLFGEEVSLFAFCDGTEAVLIGAARDHKRVGENDTGPNTGGMGAVSPPPDFDVAAQEAALDLTVRPMLAEMQRRGTPFKGVIFAGLMLTDAGPKLIEYNVRFGDPEAEALLLRLESDLLPILSGLAKGGIGDLPIRFSDKIAISIVIAAQGYPATPKKGGVIAGIEAANALEGVKVFHAGTSMKDGHLVADGGRVLAVAALGDDLNAALTRGYEAVSTIKWDDGFYRRDIGR
ncbi:phosphoribosylamine--glycine ligase [Candidatus Kirkpatrickella diaphorinae]|uniref:Phosphoribosylamine--glycine ligase n=1 Tax=Candidatus Kirkpatrickella diaphorinae TaxID=2984322 RepID=A0ABY6GJ32_9PROT|nr:phosphoribosylamine--glycine ligase [Candidatus Kirkpatrickella diaphorinae]UYH51529.1 phosphoribosylamine--glycine ligase [Candidatus Kirkpatrickella diaphorinae]